MHSSPTCMVFLRDSNLVGRNDRSRFLEECMLTTDDAWRNLAGDATPIAHELRHACAARWVRFHSLPDSKRYAGCESEYIELLARHNTIINKFTTSGDVLHLLTANFSDTKEARDLPHEEGSRNFTRLYLRACHPIYWWFLSCPSPLGHWIIGILIVANPTRCQARLDDGQKRRQAWGQYP